MATKKHVPAKAGKAAVKPVAKKTEITKVVKPVPKKTVKPTEVALVKKTAPSYYDSLHSHTSWTMLFFRFLFDKKLSIFDRTIRKDRGKVALTDQSIPDVEIFEKHREEVEA